MRVSSRAPAADPTHRSPPDDLSGFYAFPEAHWPRLRTTNGLETKEVAQAA
jgi:hypothetical protein